jgi:hypothetical protein
MNNEIQCIKSQHDMDKSHRFKALPILGRLNRQFINLPSSSFMDHMLYIKEQTIIHKMAVHLLTHLGDFHYIYLKLEELLWSSIT